MKPKRRILVDGTNLMHRLPEAGGLSKPKKAALVAQEIAKRFPNAEITIVFDGFPFVIEGLPVGVTPAFSMDGTGDDLISKKLASKSKQAATVVTHDRDLAARCRLSGAMIDTPPDFITVGKALSGEKPETEENWREKLLKLRFNG